MYTVCYVVTDDEKLAHYGELIISIASLRKQRHDGPVAILTDEATAAELELQDRHDHEALHAELRVVDTPKAYSQTERSRFIKTSVREHVDGDLLFLDTDTVVARPLGPGHAEELAVALDCNVYLEQRPEPDLQRLSDLNAMCGYTLDVAWPYYNSGCIWARDTEGTRAFFRKWHEEWGRCRERGMFVDQPALNYVNRSMGGAIQELDGVYNVQVTATPTPMGLLGDAKIIHYWKGKYPKVYLLQDPSIRSLGYQSEEVQRILSSPQTAFFPSMLVPMDVYRRVYRFNRTAIIRTLEKTYRKRSTLFRLIDGPFSLRARLWSRIKDRRA